MRKYLLLAALICSVSVSSETLFVENFNYPVSARIDTCGGWYLPYGGQSQFSVTNGLAFNGYAGSDIGNAILLDAKSGGNDLPHHHFSRVVTDGDVYVAFLFQPSVVNKKGYFFMLRDEIAPNTYNFTGRIFMDDSYHIGLTFGDNQKAVFSDEELDYQTTYLLVLKYSVLEGEHNDQVSLYVFTRIPDAEPDTPAIGPLTDPAKPDIAPANVVLRGYDADGWLVVDGICVATTWGEALQVLHTAVSAPIEHQHRTSKFVENGQLLINCRGQRYNVLGLPF